ncbi:MAG: hypothetical protein IJD57_01670 [Candidatus Gastranaerophilales bacterium]|nr:hypothetical protein [Candidatus Gastranaerophilales bacterium]
MFQSPKEYLIELEERISELKAELAELEPVYETLCKLYKNDTTNTIYTSNKRKELLKAVAKEMTAAEKIRQAQFARHKRERDGKLPKIKDCIKTFGPQSIKGLYRKTGFSTGTVKKILEENKDMFFKNENNLWDLK